MIPAPSGPKAIGSVSGKPALEARVPGHGVREIETLGLSKISGTHTKRRRQSLLGLATPNHLGLSRLG